MLKLKKKGVSNDTYFEFFNFFPFFFVDNRKRFYIYNYVEGSKK